MNLDLTNILKRFGPPRYGERLAAVRDWHLLLLVGFVLLMASVGWNAWYFLHLSTTEINPVSVSSNETATSTDPVGEARSLRATIEAEGLRYENEYRFTDPGK